MNGTNSNEGQPEYKPLDFGDVLKRAFDLYKENLGLLIVVHLVGGLLSLCTIGILAGPLYAGVSLVMLALYDRKDPKPVVGDLFKGFDFFLPAFLLFLVVCAVMIPVSMITGPLSSIAGLVAGTVTMFSYFLIVERKMDFWPAIVESYNMVKENFWVYLGLYVVGWIGSALGFIACCIGIVVTAPYLSCVTVIAYRETRPTVRDAVVSQDMAPNTSMA
ncbi:MAG TPA: hypothetical protein PKM67_00860 [Kiritimatiellia bacterium]|nr:hypothetical protein [Kiritimatiellia bacterium]HNR94324.1 hypothetical protein [Kiritimatiellia bacterium]HNS79993.1 hypothetical protein [Kiritimatiellia bacterium]HPA77083.1 hypothetical protein [Kiritimatiellia bacterium]HQQ03359.1 hypothetical protein [Kiritimatiellia bacterium]